MSPRNCPHLDMDMLVIISPNPVFNILIEVGSYTTLFILSLTCVPDVLGEVACRDKHLSHTHIIIGNENYFQQISNFWVRVHRRSHINYELHDSLCLQVGGKSFATKYANSGYVLLDPLSGIHFFHLLVPIYHPHDVH